MGCGCHMDGGICVDGLVRKGGWEGQRMKGGLEGKMVLC